jgi:lipopolysaccharide/colanic/teichoic acid biosynthesis glycosyltransferase
MFEAFTFSQAGAWEGTVDASGHPDTNSVTYASRSPDEPVAAIVSQGFDLIRLADVTIALLVLIALAPLMIIIALSIRLTDSGKVLFRHERVGRSGKRFDCLKFRTMCEDSDEILANHLASNPAARIEWDSTFKLTRDPRVSLLGFLLRKTSMDELPQLINVLRGDMSLVGPRPVVAQELLQYGKYMCYYLRVRPGITGLWQVSGRNNTTYRRRIACDVIYVRTYGLAANLGIMFRTVRVVLLGRGAY